jgi:hypothetical protein
MKFLVNKIRDIFLLVMPRQTTAQDDSSPALPRGRLRHGFLPRALSQADRPKGVK